jgi:formylglycine-generating enzyme required for sulfatase activity/peptidoglycan hydrolase-like protein with peptidoglycan-binding domain
MKFVVAIMPTLRRFVLALALCAVASCILTDYQAGYDAYQRGDYATALRKLKPLAEQGDAKAQSNLGTMYYKGQGIRQDYAEAVNWYRKAADQEYAKAQHNLGVVYAEGQGVPQDYAKAVNWYRKAAEQGNAKAQYNLGVIFAEGQGVRQDYAKAVNWYRKAADQGVALAQLNLKELESKLASTAATTTPQFDRYRDLNDPGICALALTPPSSPLDWDRQKSNIGRVQEAKRRGLTLQRCAKLAGRQTKIAASAAPQEVFSPAETSGQSSAALPPESDRRPEAKYSVDLIKAVQGRLAILGYSPGSLDGIIGRKTRDAVRAFQRDEGLFPTGEVTETLGQLLESTLTSKQERTKPVTTRPVTPREVVDLGNFHALVIGNDAYRALPRLRTAVKDAKAVAKLLESRYGFRATTLTNATRVETIQALDALRSKLTERDNLLIYYAGHGKLDRGSDRGFWLPVDAKEDSRANWLNNVTITDTLKAIQAKHVMVVADSCYSGTLTRDTRGVEVRVKKSDYVAKTHRKKSRTVLASGGLEPVSDSGGSGHSVFAKAFMDALRDNEGVIDGLDVFVYVRKQVRLNADQVPNYANIRYAGHEVGGDFLFARKTENRSEAKQDKPTVAATRPAPVQQPSLTVQPVVGVFPKTYKPGDTFKDCTDCPEMVVVPAGSFDMGDLSGDGDSFARPVHRVTIPRPFAVGVYEVTQAEWRSVMGSNPSRFKGDRNPVEKVSWEDAKDFVRRLSAKTGKEYRLLSEAEWEYVARAGSRTKYPWGNSIDKLKAKYGSRDGTRPVGSYGANAFGLYDTAGNVWEWTEDHWNAGYYGAPSNGEARTTGISHLRVLRGGDWAVSHKILRSALRNSSNAAKEGGYGFRIARTVSR